MGIVICRINIVVGVGIEVWFTFFLFQYVYGFFVLFLLYLVDVGLGLVVDEIVCSGVTGLLMIWMRVALVSERMVSFNSVWFRVVEVGMKLVPLFRISVTSSGRLMVVKLWILFVVFNLSCFGLRMIYVGWLFHEQGGWLYCG